jgi:hypothetical protein
MIAAIIRASHHQRTRIDGQTIPGEQSRNSAGQAIPSAVVVGRDGVDDPSDHALAPPIAVQLEADGLIKDLLETRRLDLALISRWLGEARITLDSRVAAPLPYWPYRTSLAAGSPTMRVAWRCCARRRAIAMRG